MHTSELHVLQESWDQHGLAVRHGIDINLDPFQEAVDAQRTRRGDLTDPLQLASQVVWCVREVNGESADHIRRTHNHRIADLLGERERIGATASEAPLRLQDAQTIQERGESDAVFCLVNRLKRCAKERYACGGEWRRKVQRRLTAELHKCGECLHPLR